MTDFSSFKKKVVLEKKYKVVGFSFSSWFYFQINLINIFFSSIFTSSANCWAGNLVEVS